MLWRKLKQGQGTGRDKEVLLFWGSWCRLLRGVTVSYRLKSTLAKDPSSYFCSRMLQAEGTGCAKALG